MSAWIFLIIKYSTIVKANFIPQSQISFMETSVFQALRLEKQLRDQESISFFTHAGTEVVSLVRISVPHGIRPYRLPAHRTAGGSDRIAAARSEHGADAMRGRASLE